MANVNALTKRNQIALFVAVLFALAAAVGGGWYLSTADKRKADSLATKEPVPDMSGVVNQTFDNKALHRARLHHCGRAGAGACCCCCCCCWRC